MRSYLRGITLHPTGLTKIPCDGRALDEAVVKALRERAARKGRSTEAEHREILRDALIANRRRTSFKAALQSLPDVGDDADFARPRTRQRRVRL